MRPSAATPAPVLVPIPETRPIPGGRFTMGSSHGRDDASPPHEVEVRAFALGRTPVTNSEYRPFVESGRVDPPPFCSDPAFCSDRQPVVGITWDDAVAYACWLSEITEGRWRLPTEAEWERAARGGLEGCGTSWGDALPIGEVPDGPLRGPWEVGQGSPNGFDLFDMGTIVHEWSLDWYSADYYEHSPHLDPRGPDEGERRSSRGGSWRHQVRWSPPSARSSLPPSFRYADYGFRVLRETPSSR